MSASKYKLLLLVLAAVSITGNAQAKDIIRETAAPTTLDVELVGAGEKSKEEGEIIAALQNLLNGLAHHKMDQISSCLSDDVTMYDNKSKLFLHGKESVLEHVKKNVLGSESNRPVKKIVVYNPFVHIKGETAMVSFKAAKDLADDTKLESYCSEVFERKNGQWLVLQLKTDWQPAKAHSAK